MQLLINEIENMRMDLNNTIKTLRKTGYDKAKAEYIYRIALSKEF